MSTQDLSAYKDSFVKSAKEHLEAVEYQLSLFSSSVNTQEVIDEIYRRIHSLKGSSTLMGQREISELCSKIIDTVHPDNAKNTVDNERVNQLTSQIGQLKKFIENL